MPALVQPLGAVISYAKLKNSNEKLIKGENTVRVIAEKYKQNCVSKARFFKTSYTDKWIHFE
jgi:hypothetical protein